MAKKLIIAGSVALVVVLLLGFYGTKLRRYSVIPEQIESFLGSGISATFYRNPVVSMDRTARLFEENAGILISSDDKAGLFLNLTPSTNGNRSKIVINGKNIRGTATVRVKYDDGESTYLKMSKGSVVLSVCDAAKVELLIYSDADYEYQLQSVTTEESEANRCIGDLQTYLGEVARVIPYQNQQLTRNDQGFVIGSETEGGVFFNFSFSSTSRRKITLRGKNLAGTTKLRTRFDQEDPNYRKIRDHSITIEVCDASEVELLVYSEDNFAYQLEDIDVEDSAGIRCDSDLKVLLLESIPDLKQALAKDRLKAARLLLDWAANANDFGFAPNIYETYEMVSEFSAAQTYFEVYLPDEGGTFCGGASIFYDKVMKLFDFDSFTVNFGDLPNSRTHVTVLLAHKKNGNLEFYLFDPTANFTLRDRETQTHINVEDFLFGDITKVDMEIQSLDERDYYSPLDVNQPKTFKEKAKHEEYLVGNRIGFGIDDFFRSFPSEKGTESDFELNLEGLAGLFRNRVFSVGKAKGRLVSETFKELLEKRKIPIGRM